MPQRGRAAASAGLFGMSDLMGDLIQSKLYERRQTESDERRAEAARTAQQRSAALESADKITGGVAEGTMRPTTANALIAQLNAILGEDAPQLTVPVPGPETRFRSGLSEVEEAENLGELPTLGSAFRRLHSFGPTGPTGKPTPFGIDEAQRIARAFTEKKTQLEESAPFVSVTGVLGPEGNLGVRRIPGRLEGFFPTETSETRTRDLQDLRTHAAAIDQERWAAEIDLGGLPQFMQGPANTTRAQYNSESQRFFELRNAVVKLNRLGARVLAGESGGAALSMVFTFMKVNDPNSQVTAGEADAASRISGLDERFVNMWNSVFRGEQLDPKSVQDMMDTAGEMLLAASAVQADVDTQFSRIEEQMGLRPGFIVRDLTAIADLSEGVERDVMQLLADRETPVGTPVGTPGEPQVETPGEPPVGPLVGPPSDGPSLLERLGNR